MYRSSLTLAFCRPVLGGRCGQRPVIRLRGARRNLRAFRQRLRASGPNPAALRGTRLRISAALLLDPAYRAPAAVYGDYDPPYAARPVYVDRAPAYPERYYARVRYYARDRYSAQEYDYEYAPRPPLPVPYRARGTMRRRLWRVGVLRLKPLARRQ